MLWSDAAESIFVVTAAAFTATTATARTIAVGAAETAIATTATTGAAAVATTAAFAATAAVATAATTVATAAAFTATAAVAAATGAATATTVAAATTFTAAATAAATVGAAEASRTLFTRTGFVHDDRTTGNGLTVQAVDGSLRFSVIAHFHKAEALGTAGFTVHHDLGRCNSTIFGESVLQILIAHGIGQIAHVKFVAHERAPFKVTK